MIEGRAIVLGDDVNTDNILPGPYLNVTDPQELGRHLLETYDPEIAARVQPGDILVGDNDGVVVIPPAIVEEVVDAALAQEDEDAWVAQQVAAGHPVEGLFPMNERWRSEYRRSRETT